MKTVFAAGNKIVTACDTCRKRKRKCDGAAPTCSWCAAKDIECRYTMERPKRARPSTAYLEELEAEIDVLKQQVDRLQSSATLQAQAALIAKEDVDGSPSSSVSSEAGKSRPFQDFGVSEAAQEISSLMWRLKVDDAGNTSFIGPSGNFCFTSDAAEASTQPTPTLPGSTIRTGEMAKVLKEPSRSSADTADIEEELLYLFKQFINPIYQFLDQGTIRSLEVEGTTPQLTFLRYSTLSAAAILSEDSRIREHGDNLFAEAESMTLASCRSQPTVGSIQALCLLGWRELGLENENMAWMYISMACSMTLHLGLSVSSLGPLDKVGAQKTSQQPFASHSVRSQTFWAVLFQERIATSLLGRHPLIPSTRVRAKGFLSTLGRPPALQEAVFDFHCELWFIHDKFMDKIYSFEFPGLRLFDQLKLLLEARENLAEFKQRLNLVATRSDDSDPLLYCHMSFYMSQLLIHRPFLHPKAPLDEIGAADDNEEDLVESRSLRLAAQTSYQAAGGIARLIRTAVRLRGPITLSKAPIFVVHCILTAAVTLLMFATSRQSQLRSQAISRFRTCFNAMSVASQTWRRATKGIAVIKELAQRWGVASAIPLQHGMFSIQEASSNLANSQKESPAATFPEIPGTSNVPTSKPSNVDTLEAIKGHFNPWLFPTDDPTSDINPGGPDTTISREHTAITGIGSFDPTLFADLNLEMDLDLLNYDSFVSLAPYNEQEPSLSAENSGP